MTLLLEVGTFVGKSTRVGGETAQVRGHQKLADYFLFSSALISSLLLPDIGPRRSIPSLIYLIYLAYQVGAKLEVAYQVGAKFKVAYQEGL